MGFNVRMGDCHDMIISVSTTKSLFSILIVSPVLTLLLHEVEVRKSTLPCRPDAQGSMTSYFLGKFITLRVKAAYYNIAYLLAVAWLFLGTQIY